MPIQTFRRVEKKYIIKPEEYSQLMILLKDKMQLDNYSPETICNIYYDTDNYSLIQKSLEGPIYKEKIRIRSYDIPEKNTNIYLEIKKKYKNIVSKRRISLSLKDLQNYFSKKETKTKNRQIQKELDYCFSFYDLKPKIYLAYDREAFLCKDNTNFRITFDYNIRSRNYDLSLDKGTYGEYLIKKDKYIMEVKSIETFPLWFSKILTKLKIYPQSFSKYGEIYKLKNQYKYV